MTEVIAKIDKESIILFDEPEIHLHPNAIANVMRMFNSILEEFDSYAIIATHSPIILQELPSKNIIVLDRMDDQLFTRTPEIECFGENVSLITRDIFDVTSKESFYQSFFTRLKEKGKTKEEIEELFDDNLSLNATVFLESLYR
jgi:predicted ATP-dependent endonuclease of OLD family